MIAYVSGSLGLSTAFWRLGFWLASMVIGYTLAGYPALLWLLAHSSKRKDHAPDDACSMTLIICAHNEAASLEAKLEATLALRYAPERLQIIVASDGSSDATNAITQSFSSRGVELLHIARQMGKTHAQNAAVLIARGEILVFSDATTRYHPDALRFLAGNFADEEVGAVSGQYFYEDSTRTSPNAAGAAAYASYDNSLRNAQSQLGSICGCCGCIYALRRTLYTALEDHLISDLVQPLHIIRQGYRVTFEPRALAWETSSASSKIEFRMRVRVVARAVTGLLSVGRLLLPWHGIWIAMQLWSHKVLRWILPISLLVLFDCSIALRQDSKFYQAVLALQLALYGLALLTLVFPVHRMSRLLGVPLYFCTVNAAAIAGLLQYVRGKRHVVWSPERGTS